MEAIGDLQKRKSYLSRQSPPYHGLFTKHLSLNIFVVLGWGGSGGGSRGEGIDRKRHVPLNIAIRRSNVHSLFIIPHCFQVGL